MHGPPLSRETLRRLRGVRNVEARASQALRTLRG